MDRRGQLGVIKELAEQAGNGVDKSDCLTCRKAWEGEEVLGEDESASSGQRDKDFKDGEIKANRGGC